MRLLLRRSDVLSIDETAETCRNDDIDRIDSQPPYKQRTEDGNPAGEERYVCPACEIPRRHGEEGYDGRADACKHRSHPWNILKLPEEHCDGKDDEKRGKGRPHCAGESSGRLAQLVAYERGNVDCKHSGAGLSHGNEVKKLRLVYPLVFIYHLRLDDGYHCIPASEGEQSYTEERSEQATESA